MSGTGDNPRAINQSGEGEDVLGELRNLIIANAESTRELHNFVTDVHRIVNELSGTLGSAARRAMLSSWEESMVTALELTVEGRLPGGEHGALAVKNREGEELVLKIFPKDKEQVVRTGIGIARRMGQAGMPVPDPLMVGTAEGLVFLLQERCAAQVADPLSPVHATQVLDAWKHLIGACPEGGDWPEAVARAVSSGDAELWAEHGPIRASFGRGSTILDEIIAVSRDFDFGSLRRSDAVHRDFHHRNFLVDADELVAVIDWEAARPGDARYDLVVLSFWSAVTAGREVDREAADIIESFTADAVPKSVRACYSSLYALQQLWYTAVHRPDRTHHTDVMIEERLAPMWRI